MKKLLMTALLLGSAYTAAQSAAAQTTIPARPTGSAAPVTAAPVTAPASAATPNVAPSAAPAAGAPVSETSAVAAPMLQLSAPVGSTSELSSTSTSRITISNVQVVAAPGSKISQAKLKEIRRSMDATLGKTQSVPVITISGKTFLKVAGRDSAGNTTLLSTVTQTLPSMPGAPASSKQGAASKTPQNLTMKITQVIAPSGKVSGLKIESDDPQLSAAFKALSSDKLESVAQQQGGFTSIYGTPLVVGTPHTTSVQVDAQNMLSSILTSVAGPQGQQLFGKVEADPMTITTTTTYKGTDAQGRHSFESRSSYDSWKVNLNTAPGSEVAMQMKIELANVTANANSLYRADGMPSSLQGTTDMKMKLTMITEGVQVSMNMDMNQQMNMQPR